MERDVQQRLCVAAERMGTGLLRTGAALERIATVMEKQPPSPADCSAPTTVQGQPWCDTHAQHLSKCAEQPMSCVFHSDCVGGVPALREWGPDVGDPPDAKTRDYIHPDLERQVMEAIARYPQSRIRPDGSVHGLAAAAAIQVVEKWLLARGHRDPYCLTHCSPGHKHSQCGCDCDHAPAEGPAQRPTGPHTHDPSEWCPDPWCSRWTEQKEKP